MKLTIGDGETAGTRQDHIVGNQDWRQNKYSYTQEIVHTFLKDGENDEL